MLDKIFSCIFDVNKKIIDMKYYKNKKTNNIIGIKNQRHLITHPTEQSESLGFVGYSYTVIYDMICPNILLGNGITSFSISHTYLKENFKRIRREIALEKYPGFKQYDFNDLVKESEERGVDRLDILMEQDY